jgi:hypothetical protein
VRQHRRHANLYRKSFVHAGHLKVRVFVSFGWRAARGACGPGEDPSIYVDKRGHVHCVYHRAPFNETGKDGGHAFSVDGRDPWFCVDGKGGHGRCTPDSPPAYNTTIVPTFSREYV